MRRSLKRHRRHRSGSTSLEINEPSLPSGWPTSTAFWVSPAQSRSLAGGAVVRIVLAARLLGLQLLTFEGSVVLMPLPSGMPEDHPTRPRTASRHKAIPASSRLRAGLRPSGRTPVVVAGIGASARLIDESVEDLRALDHRP